VIMMITDKVCACVQSQSKQSYHNHNQHEASKPFLNILKFVLIYKENTPI